jgi:hypothetical protein
VDQYVAYRAQQEASDLSATTGADDGDAGTSRPVSEHAGRVETVDDLTMHDDFRVHRRPSGERLVQLPDGGTPRLGEAIRRRVDESPFVRWGGTRRRESRAPAAPAADTRARRAGDARARRPHPRRHRARPLSPRSPAAPSVQTGFACTVPSRAHLEGVSRQPGTGPRAAPGRLTSSSSSARSPSVRADRSGKWSGSGSMSSTRIAAI